MLASIRGHTQVVRLLLECKDIQVDLVDNDGVQAIHRAAQYGYPDITQLLLTHGGSVIVQTEPGFPWSGRTPLFLACESLQGEADKTPGSPTRNFTRCVQILLDKGANVHVVNAIGWTPLHTGCRYGNNTDIICQLLSHRADVNSPIANGSTPLLLASEAGFVSAVEILLQHNANCDTQNDKGDTPLYVACQKGHLSCAELLIKYRAGVNTQRNLGAAPLHVACQYNHPSCVSALMRAGADVSLRLYDGSTPLMMASMYGSLECVQLLLNVSDSNAKNAYGYTALHWACAKGHTNCTRVLLDAGADLSPHSDSNSTPLSLAAESGHVSCVELLLCRGAEVQWEGDKSPLHLAKFKGHTAVVDLLKDYQ